jgi:endonuclease/exonuclease/phosphatase family metal-dependent hydrolase
VGPTVSVAFSARWGVRVDGSEPAIGGLDADVIALQEVWSSGPDDDSLSRVVAALGYEVAELTLTERASRETRALAATDHSSTGRWQLAVLSRFGLEAPRSLHLGRARVDPVARAVLLVDVPVGDQVVSVATVHLTHQIAAAPRQVRRVGRRLRQACGPLVLTGDFNCVGTLVRMLLPRLRPAVQARTRPASRPLVQLDHVLAGAGVRVVRGTILADLGSDHLPVRAELSLEPKR